MSSSSSRTITMTPLDAVQTELSTGIETPSKRSSTSRMGLLHRRHSSYGTARSRRQSLEVDPDVIYIKVELFLTEVESKLAWIEEYGNTSMDAGINKAYDILESVRESCSHVSGELFESGRRRAQLFVEAIEPHYKDILATKSSLEAKAQTGMKILEGYLAEIETRTHVYRKASISAVMDRGWRKAEDTLNAAKEAVDETLQLARQAKVALKTSIETAIASARERGLIRYEELPVPWRVNENIVRGYRFHVTKVECLKSVFVLSNELVNIWSHFAGLVIVASIAFYFYPTSSHWVLSTKSDIFFASCFFFAAAKCLVCSCMWHTMNSIADQTLMERFACVDYTGISLLIATSIMTTEYTAFYCEPVSRWVYLITTAMLGIGGTIIPWHPYFNRAENSWLRVAFFVSLGATGFAPVLQLLYTRGIDWVYYFYAPIFKSITVYLVGACIYAAKWPEKLVAPGKGWFDYFGGSHNIWHFAVLGGIIFHYSAMYEMYANAFVRRGQECSVY